MRRRYHRFSRMRYRGRRHYGRRYYHYRPRRRSRMGRRMFIGGQRY